MPYVKQSERELFQFGIDDIAQNIDEDTTPGQLNYILTKVALSYLTAHGRSYTTMAEIVSAFECAKLEFVRRQVDGYEDLKIKENGDVS